VNVSYRAEIFVTPGKFWWRGSADRRRCAIEGGRGPRVIVQVRKSARDFAREEHARNGSTCDRVATCVFPVSCPSDLFIEEFDGLSVRLACARFAAAHRVVEFSPLFALRREPNEATSRFRKYKCFLLFLTSKNLSKCNKSLFQFIDKITKRFNV